MKASRLINRFEALGARLKLNEPDDKTHWLVTPMKTSLAIEVKEDHLGEYFNLSGDPEKVGQLRVTDYRPSLQYMLLALDRNVPLDQRQLFKCGNDGLGWYVRDESDSLRDRGLVATIDYLKFKSSGRSDSLLQLT